MRNYKLWIDGRWVDGTKQNVISPFTNKGVATVEYASAEQLKLAVKASSLALKKTKLLSRFKRSQLLDGMASKIAVRKSEFVERMIEEAGKPRTLSEAEVDRAISTFTIARDEAKRITGQMIPLDFESSGRAYGDAQTYLFARGPVLAIAPFNFPLNLVAHKLAPALAVGAPILVKPPHQAPGCATLLAEIFAETAKEISDKEETIPLAFFQVINAPSEEIEKLVSSPEISVLSFTGSDKVGWKLQQKATKKKVALELGGNAAVIVHSDCDLKLAAQRCAYGSFAYAGQICISVQRVIVQKSVADTFEKLLLEETKKVKVGDPSLKETLVGPVIDDKARNRLEEWLKEAVASGAKTLIGGQFDGRMMSPTILKSVKRDQKIYTEEVFGPLVLLESYDQFEEALEIVNHSRFGLQAGLFTENQKLVRQAVEALDVGGIIVNDIPTYRADNMPYGGVKDSGLGREGIIYAMQDYTENKVVVSKRT